LWQFVKKPISQKIKQALRFGVLALVLQLIVEYFILRYPMVMRAGHYLGIYLLSFPIEDILFFLTIPLLVFPLVHIVDDLFSPC
jgi:hypothetical protein